MVQKRFSQMMRAPLVSDKTRMPKHCPVCGLKIAKTSTEVAAGGASYHAKCITTLECDSCGATMGYIIDGSLKSGRLTKTFCQNCGRSF